MDLKVLVFVCLLVAIVIENCDGENYPRIRVRPRIKIGRRIGILRRRFRTTTPKSITTTESHIHKHRKSEADIEDSKIIQFLKVVQRDNLLGNENITSTRPKFVKKAKRISRQTGKRGFDITDKFLEHERRGHDVKINKVNTTPRPSSTRLTERTTTPKSIIRNTNMNRTRSGTSNRKLGQASHNVTTTTPRYSSKRVTTGTYTPKKITTVNQSRYPGRTTNRTSSQPRGNVTIFQNRNSTTRVAPRVTSLKTTIPRVTALRTTTPRMTIPRVTALRTTTPRMSFNVTESNNTWRTTKSQRHIYSTTPTSRRIFISDTTPKINSTATKFNNTRHKTGSQVTSQPNRYGTVSTTPYTRAPVTQKFTTPKPQPNIVIQIIPPLPPQVQTAKPLPPQVPISTTQNAPQEPKSGSSNIPSLLNSDKKEIKNKAKEIKSQVNDILDLTKTLGKGAKSIYETIKGKPESKNTMTEKPRNQPNVPGVSTVPGISTAPGISIAPGISTAPGISIAPGIRTVPGISTAPGISIAPGISTAPGISIAPGISTVPGITTTTQPTIAARPLYTIIKPIVPASIAVPTTRNKPTSTKSPAVITDDEIWRLTEDLFANDDSNAMKYITMNLQTRIEGFSVMNNLNASNKWKVFRPLVEKIFQLFRLLRVDPEAYSIPSIHTVREVYDNYEMNTLIKENVTCQKRREENLLIDILLDTNVMLSAMKWLAKKNFIDTDEFGMKEALKQIWFTQFNGTSSPFERIFLAEINPGDSSRIIGAKNWVYFNYLESMKLINYMGYKTKVDLGDKASLIKLQFRLKDVINRDVVLFVGPSPEFEMALYTICAYARPNGICLVSLGGVKITLYTSIFRYYGKDLINSAKLVF